jgi:SPP1 gp7 family putative phage head morphogenesis protein
LAASGGGEPPDAGYHADFYALSATDQPIAARVIGSPALVTARATLSAMPAWQQWRDQIATVVMGADEATLSARLDAWAKDASSDEALQDSPIAGSIYEATMHADMAGQLFVRQIEVPESSERANDAAIRDPFLALTFDDALRYFLDRRLLTPEQFASLSDAAKARSFTATRLASDALRQRCRDLLAASIRDGGTYEEFRAGLLDESVSLGIEAASPAYLETVYRTNVVGAYGAGRFRQLTSPAVRAARPFVEYRTAGDTRVRPAHAAMRGVVFSQDDPDWPKYAPPNGFQCRCTTVARRADQVDPGRIMTAASLSALTVEVDGQSVPVRPDDGFDAAPTI